MGKGPTKYSRRFAILSGQSRSSIAYFWNSRLFVTLAKITHSNALKWAMAHNKSKNPDRGAEKQSPFNDFVMIDLRP